MKTTIKSTNQTTTASRIAGEDIKTGDFVSILSEICQLPSYFWNCSDVVLPPDELVQFRYLPHDSGQPFKVVGVCLPFVYVKRHKGNVFALDTRKQELVRLNRHIGNEVWKRLRKMHKKSK